MEYRYPSPVDSALSRNEHDREDGPMLPQCEWNRNSGASTPTCADAGDPRASLLGEGEGRHGLGRVAVLRHGDISDTILAVSCGGTGAELGQTRRSDRHQVGHTQKMAGWKTAGESTVVLSTAGNEVRGVVDDGKNWR